MMLWIISLLLSLLVFSLWKNVALSRACERMRRDIVYLARSLDAYEAAQERTSQEQAELDALTEMKRDQYYSKLLQHLLQHLEGRP